MIDVPASLMIMLMCMKWKCRSMRDDDNDNDWWFNVDDALVLRERTKTFSKTFSSKHKKRRTIMIKTRKDRQICK